MDILDILAFGHRQEKQLEICRSTAERKDQPICPKMVTFNLFDVKDRPCSINHSMTIFVRTVYFCNGRPFYGKPLHYLIMITLISKFDNSQKKKRSNSGINVKIPLS